MTAARENRSRAVVFVSGLSAIALLIRDLRPELTDQQNRWNGRRLTSGAARDAGFSPGAARDAGFTPGATRPRKGSHLTNWICVSAD